MYRNTPEMPHPASSGKSLILGSLIFLIAPTMHKVIDATPKRSSINAVGLYDCNTYLVAGKDDPQRSTARNAARYVRVCFFVVVPSLIRGCLRKP